MINKPIVGVAALVFVLAAAGLYYLKGRNPPLPAAPSAPVLLRPRAPSQASPILCRKAPGMRLLRALAGIGRQRCAAARGARATQ